MLVLAMANLCFGMLLGWVLAEKERAEAGESAAVRSAEEARAHALQSRMNPHVLFNAISGLAELVREEPEAAERALLNLSGLLRNLLDYGTRLSAPLSLERTMLEQYLSLEQIRLGKRLQIEWAWDVSLEGHELPPLLVQPLVENALKHGIAPHRPGGQLRILIKSVQA
jgi:sensor histidine kinase YesM